MINSLVAGEGFLAITAKLLAGTMTVTAYITAVQVILISYIKTVVATKLFVQAVGEDVAAVVALVMAAYAIGKGYQNSNMCVKGAPVATELLAVSNGLVNAITESYGMAMKGLKAEYDEFSNLIKEKTEELEKAQSLLDKSPILQPSDLLRLEPEALFATVHYGNIGALGIDSVSSYVASALTLPTFNDTIGSKRYA